MIINEFDKISFSDDEEHYSEQESINDINQDFFDRENLDDSISKNNHKINNKLYNFSDLKGSLVNKNNPFSNEYQQYLKNKYNNKKDKLANNLDNNSNNDRNLNTNDPYISKPPRIFQSDFAKILIKNDIITSDVDLKGDRTKKTDNYWYSKFEYNNKKFYQITNHNQENSSDHIIYFCTKHNTTIKSSQYTSNGNKKKIALCNARVYYYKNKKTYYIDWDHSNYCNEIIRKVYNNIADINDEVNNYKEFRESIENYLDKYPLIKYSKFILKANKLYYKKNCNFDIKENTLKNIYYNWRKKSMTYTKFYAFNNNLCKNQKVFLKEYRNLYLYKSNGKKQFNHEHFIFCPDFFINELNKSEHWYINATFIYPFGFKELIVILYIDKDTNKRFPGMFILTNNKHFEGYNLIFGSVKRILTIENSKKLNLKTYCTDYEKSLIKACSLNFKEARGVGCYYHFCENIYNNAKKFGIVAKNNGLDYEFLNLYYKLPFNISNDKNILDYIKNKYTNIKPKNISEKYLTFINYFENQWLEYIDNGYINYFNLKKEYRSNSYLENYNRNIKLKLSEYLLGKNQCKLNWPLIIQFLRNEEEFYRLKKF